ncbi:hypothetical protein [Kingella denitrificans]
MGGFDVQAAFRRLPTMVVQANAIHTVNTRYALCQKQPAPPAIGRSNVQAAFSLAAKGRASTQIAWQQQRFARAFTL